MSYKFSENDVFNGIGKMNRIDKVVLQVALEDVHNAH